MRNRRDIRTKKEVKSRKFYIITAILIISIILLSITRYLENVQNKEKSRKQKEELLEQTQSIFSELDKTIENTNNEIDKVVNISAVGDILCNEELLKDAKKDENYDFSNMFSEVAKYTKESDMAIGTFESNIVDGENYSGIGKYNSPNEFLKAIKNTGINILSVAHNHSLDYGVAGLNETVEKIHNEEISVTGIKNNTENENSTFTGNIKEINGVKIAVLSYTYGLSNESELTEEEKAYANLYEEEKVKYDIEYAKEKSNFIIVIMHWGEVNNSSISRWQIDIKNYLIDNGVDMILGSHPSIIEPMEVVKNSDGKNVLVAYSLGNYISSLTYSNADVELILNIQILKKSGEEKAVLRKVDYTPIYLLDNGKDAENRFELKDMKKLALDYLDGDTSKINRQKYNSIVQKIEWLNKVVNNQEGE